jgi:hypothetical protein
VLRPQIVRSPEWVRHLRHPGALDILIVLLVVVVLFGWGYIRKR